MTVASKHYLPYTLSVQMSEKQTHIHMRLRGELYTTGSLPETVQFLETNYPCVLETRCFNDAHISFVQEVRDTEIGHLFEHIVLAQMLEQNGKAVYQGWTEWDWKVEKKGSFTITVNVGRKEKKQLQLAIRSADSLLSRLFLQHTDGWETQPSVQCEV